MTVTVSVPLRPDCSPPGTHPGTDCASASAEMRAFRAVPAGLEQFGQENCWRIVAGRTSDSGYRRWRRALRVALGLVGAAERISVAAMSCFGRRPHGHPVANPAAGATPGMGGGATRAATGGRAQGCAWLAAAVGEAASGRAPAPEAPFAAPVPADATAAWRAGDSARGPAA
jgi:hypothetical protein